MRSNGPNCAKLAYEEMPEGLNLELFFLTDCPTKVRETSLQGGKQKKLSPNKYISMKWISWNLNSVCREFLHHLYILKKLYRIWQNDLLNLEYKSKRQRRSFLKLNFIIRTILAILFCYFHHFVFKDYIIQMLVLMSYTLLKPPLKILQHPSCHCLWYCHNFMTKSFSSSIVCSLHLKIQTLRYF